MRRGRSRRAATTAGWLTALALLALLALGAADAARAQARIDSAEATRLFAEANALYGGSRFDEAARLYSQVLDAGFENADVRYNLGNAFFKAGSVGRAIVEYERALRLDPGHNDARANLEFLRGQIADRQTPIGTGAGAAIVESVYGAIPSGLAAGVASALYVLLVVVLVVAVLRSGFDPATRVAAIVLAALLVASAGVTAAKIHRERNVSHAIVIVTETAVRTGPGEDFVLEFKLHEGTKVRTIEDRVEWSRVRVDGTDLEGWLATSALEPI